MNIRRKVSSVGREPVCFRSPRPPSVDPPLQHIVTFIINQTDHFLISNQDDKKKPWDKPGLLCSLKDLLQRTKCTTTGPRRILGVFEHVKLFHAILLVLLLSINRRELCVVFSCPFLCFQKFLKMQRNSVTYFTSVT